MREPLRAVFAGVPVLVLGSAPAAAQGLSHVEIEAAIATARISEPRPLALRVALDTGQVSPVVVGLIYTPLVRVALMARRAHERNRPFSAEDVPQALSAPFIYVAMRWYSASGPWQDLIERQMPDAGAVPRHTRSWRRMDRPLWSTRDVTVLKAFASPLPYQDVALVMAYPLEYASGDYDFVITKRAIKPDGLEIASVRRARLAPQP